MTKKSFLSIAMVLCVCAFGIALAACGDKDEPSTPSQNTQEFSVKAVITQQGGNWTRGEGGLNGSDSKEFKFYKSIYDKVNAVVSTSQSWEVKYTKSDKEAKFKENRELAESRYTTMIRALDAIQKELDQTDKEAFKCMFDMTIQVEAKGESVYRQGQKTIKYESN